METIYKDTSINNINTLSKILELRYDGTMSYEQRTTLREEHIRKVRKKNPDYTCWDYIEYWGFGWESPKRSSLVLISTGGLIAYDRGKDMVVKYGSPDVHGYYKTTVKETIGKFIPIMSHRAVACTFLMCPKRHNDKNVGLLEVNHKNGNKGDPSFNNLEWVTESENMQHAYDTLLAKKGLARPNAKILLGTIQIGPHKGEKYIIVGSCEMRDLKIYPRLDRSKASRGDLRYSCTWESISEKESKKYKKFPKKIAEELHRDKSKYLRYNRPIEVTVNTLERKEKFAIYGCAGLEFLNVDRDNIAERLRSKSKRFNKPLGLLTFKYIDHDEAELLPRGPNPEQEKLISETHVYSQAPLFRFTIIKEGKHHGESFIVPYSDSIIEIGLPLCSVYRVIKDGRQRVKGVFIDKIHLQDVGKYQILPNDSQRKFLGLK